MSKKKAVKTVEKKPATVPAGSELVKITEDMSPEAVADALKHNYKIQMQAARKKVRTAKKEEQIYKATEVVENSIATLQDAITEACPGFALKYLSVRVVRDADGNYDTERLAVRTIRVADAQ